MRKGSKSISSVARMGGVARASKLSASRRREIAALGAIARWQKMDKRKET